MAEITTKELLREVAERDFIILELSKHEKRLEKILDREVFHRFAGRRHSVWAQKMQTLGFRIVVDTDWVLRFKFHGDIFGRCVYEARGSKRVYYQYNGDIPEFALDKLEEFLRLTGNHDLVSIHSMEPLPVKLVRVLPVIDPVMIGWAETPRIVHRQSGWEALSNPLGVIIAAWDEYKETMVVWKRA